MARPWYLRLLGLTAEALDKTVGWAKLPPLLGVATLIGLRERLRERNLHDTSSSTPRFVRTRELDHPAEQSASEGTPRLTVRTADGTFNDLENPTMGSAGTRFGRNVPIEHTYRESDWAIGNDPNPRTVSRQLLTRDTFLPATTLNLLVAAWIQFMIRDWFKHERGVKPLWELKREEGDHWEHGNTINIPRTPPDPSRLPDDTSPPTYINTETHWWDGSQLYGSDEATQAKLRSTEGDGKLKLEDGSLPGWLLEQLAKEPGWWVGLALMFTLFAREHNAICDRLRAKYPSWSDDDLFEHARLINAALMAKIHTVEWTPALLGHPTLQIALRANWWGILGEQIHKHFGRISKSEVLSGIPGSPKDLFDVPYTLTEEFGAVYRMHPLIPDYFSFRSAATDELLRERPFELREVQDKHVREVLEQIGIPNLLYSFGIAYPGALTLHNYPRFLQEFERPDGEFMDLAATDILRMREFGVPRYNEFRKLLRLSPARTFEELTDNPAWAEEIRRVYKDDIDRVDLMVGLFAETKPQGFGISDTAFRIFILMASRRLNSDRFFTTDYTPEVYTQTGLDWINDNNMLTILSRHFPELQPSLRGAKNAFAPWQRVR